MAQLNDQIFKEERAGDACVEFRRSRAKRGWIEVEQLLRQHHLPSLGFLSLVTGAYLLANAFLSPVVDSFVFRLPSNEGIEMQRVIAQNGSVLTGIWLLLLVRCFWIDPPRWLIVNGRLCAISCIWFYFGSCSYIVRGLGGDEVVPNALLLWSFFQAAVLPYIAMTAFVIAKMDKVTVRFWKGFDIIMLAAALLALYLGTLASLEESMAMLSAVLVVSASAFLGLKLSKATCEYIAAGDKRN